MSLTGESYYGYQVEPGDCIVVDDEEIIVQEVIQDDDDIIEIQAIGPLGDYDLYYILADTRYEEWGY